MPMILLPCCLVFQDHMAKTIHIILHKLGAIKITSKEFHKNQMRL